jgi:hypothetical protein
LQEALRIGKEYVDKWEKLGAQIAEEDRKSEENSSTNAADDKNTFFPCRHASQHYNLVKSEVLSFKFMGVLFIIFCIQLLFIKFDLLNYKDSESQRRRLEILGRRKMTLATGKHAILLQNSAISMEFAVWSQTTLRSLATNRTCTFLTEEIRFY